MLYICGPGAVQQPFQYALVAKHLAELPLRSCILYTLIMYARPLCTQFAQWGNCRYGANCRFSHGMPPQQQLYYQAYYTNQQQRYHPQYAHGSGNHGAHNTPPGRHISYQPAERQWLPSALSQVQKPMVCPLLFTPCAIPNDPFFFDFMLPQGHVPNSPGASWDVRVM